MGESLVKQQLGSGLPKTKLLTVTVQVTNLSRTRKLDYSGFAIARDYEVAGKEHGAYMRADLLLKDYATLADNYGNSYRRFVYFVDGRPWSSSMAKPGPVHSGKSTRDGIVFETPVANVKHLDLAIPAASVGGRAPTLVRIPAGEISGCPAPCGRHSV